MAKSIALNHTDSGVSGVTTLTLDRAILNYGLDYRIKSQDASTAILTNMTSPVDKPETFKIAVSQVKDVYKGTNIDTNMYAPSRRGVSILCALQDTWSETDSADATYAADYPISAHLVLKVPLTATITPAMIQTALGRLISGLYDSGDATTGRLAAIMRGSLLPKDL